jgi:hypothetical protein
LKPKASKQELGDQFVGHYLSNRILEDLAKILIQVFVWLLNNECSKWFEVDTSGLTKYA